MFYQENRLIKNLYIWFSIKITQIIELQKQLTLLAANTAT